MKNKLLESYAIKARFSSYLWAFRLVLKDKFCYFALKNKDNTMYFGRLNIEETQKRNPLPIEWLEEVTKTLNEAYNDNCQKESRFFEVYGESYEKEFVVVVSFLHNTDQMAAPITLFIAHDIVEDSKAFKKVLANLLNLIGLIFDDIFATENWSEFSANWTENKYQDDMFYYKITRENISLSLQAEALLQKDIELN